LLSDSTGPIGW